MSQIATVRGPLDTAELGQTLMHEHVFVLSPEIQQNFPTGWDEEERVADAVAKLRALREVGVRTIVDLTVIGLGRYIPRVQRVNEQVDINIVVATGVYTYNEVPFYFRNPGRRAPDGTDLMASYFIADITEGIAETGVRAGALKCAIDSPGMTPGVERGEQGHRGADHGAHPPREQDRTRGGARRGRRGGGPESGGPRAQRRHG